MTQHELFFVEAEIPTWKIARALGWTPRKTRRAFVRAGAAHQLPGTCEWHVSRSWLAEMMPQIERKLSELEGQDALGMPGRARPGNTNRKGAKATGCQQL